MSIEQELNEELKSAMKAREQDKVACIRQLRSKIQEATNAAGFSGPTDDAFYQAQIQSYAKSLQKGISELEGAGEKGAPLRAKYQAEIDYLSKYLPQLLSEAETRPLVEAAVAATQASSPKDTGRVMGAVMKDHKGKVDPAIVKRLVGDLLSS